MRWKNIQGGTSRLWVKFECETRKESQWLASRELKIKIGGMHVPPNKQGSFKLQSRSICAGKISSCLGVNATSRQWIKQLGFSFHSIFRTHIPLCSRTRRVVGSHELYNTFITKFRYKHSLIGWKSLFYESTKHTSKAVAPSANSLFWKSESNVWGI